QQCERRRRFARARFAGDAETLTGGERKAHTIDGGHRALRVVVNDAQPFDGKDRLAHPARRSRGLAISASPAVRKKSPRKTMTMMTTGAVHHHHQPLMIAALKLTQ